MRRFFKKYPQIWTLLYLPFYLIWFYWLEQNVTTHFHVIYTPLDDFIPFVESFIIPYFLWFLFIPAVWFYLCFTNKKEFYQYITFLYGGMTLFLVICTVFPNGQYLRPEVVPDNSIFAPLIRRLYGADTSTNVFPSIHAYNSFAAAIAISKNARLREKRGTTFLAWVLTLLICMSTVFLKQHSLLDVAGAVVMAILFYIPVYYLPKRHAHKVGTAKNSPPPSSSSKEKPAGL